MHVLCDKKETARDLKLGMVKIKTKQNGVY